MSDKTKDLALTALMAASALVLSFIEGSFVFIPQCPGIKIGLSNIVIMFSLFCISKKTAISIALLKAIFALITRGAMAGLLSFTGGIASVGVMIMLSVIFKGASTACISIFSAITHNLSQFAVICFVYEPASMLPYLPLLLASGTVFGTANAVFLHAIKPSLLKIRGKK